MLKNVAFLIVVFSFSFCRQSSEQQEAKDSEADNLLIQGAFFQGANGVYFNDQDELHVVSVVSRLIGVVDTETGAISKTYAQEEGVEGPDDLIFGPDGSLYFTSILTGEVGRLKPDGTYSKQFVSPGVNPITFSDDGRLFVALDFQGDGLYELDPELKEEPRLIIKELGWLNGMDFGPDGYLYGPIWSKGQIVKIDVDNGALEVIVDDLKTPAAVKFDSKGVLHTVDHQTGTVYSVDVKTGHKTEIATGFVGADNIAFNSKDELFLAHAQDGSIHQIHMDGSTRVVIAPALCNASDIEIVDGQLIAPDILSMKGFDKESGTQTKMWNHMIGVPGLIGPFTIDHEDGKLALTSWFSNEVQIWDLNNNEAISTDHNYAVPINAILHEGALIVAELGTTPGAAKVLRINGDDREVLIDASKGFSVPSGLAAVNGEIYAADFFQGVVYQLTSNGAVLDAPDVVVADLKQPEGLQIGPDGQLIIVETGMDRVVSFDFTDQTLVTLVDSIPLGLQAPAGMAPTWKLSDVHFDKEGSLYVPSDIDNAIYKYEHVFD